MNDCGKPISFSWLFSVLDAFASHQTRIDNNMATLPSSSKMTSATDSLKPRDYTWEFNARDKYASWRYTKNTSTPSQVKIPQHCQAPCRSATKLIWS